MTCEEAAGEGRRVDGERSAMSESEGGFEGWATLELMGQRRLAGRISEARIAGAAFIRIDVPHPNDSTVLRATHFFSPTAVHSITPTTGEIACAIARGAPEPVTRWEPPGSVATVPWSARDERGDDCAVDGEVDEQQSAAARKGPR